MDRNLDWNAEWSHVPESWPSTDPENDVYENQLSTQAGQGDNEAEKASQRRMPDIGKSEADRKGASLHEAPDNIMDAVSQSETKHLEFA